MAPVDNGLPRTNASSDDGPLGYVPLRQLPSFASHFSLYIMPSYTDVIEIMNEKYNMEGVI